MPYFQQQSSLSISMSIRAGFGWKAIATDDALSKSVARAAIMNLVESTTKSVEKDTMAMPRGNVTDAVR